jgi:hypothetical protein
VRGTKSHRFFSFFQNLMPPRFLSFFACLPRDFSLFALWLFLCRFLSPAAAAGGWCADIIGVDLVSARHQCCAAGGALSQRRKTRSRTLT